MLFNNGGVPRSHLLLRFGFYAFVVAVIAGVLYCFSLLFIPLIVSLLLTILLGPLVNYFETRGFRRLTVLIALCVFVVVFLAAALYFFVPVMIRQILTVQAGISGHMLIVRELFEKLQAFLAEKFPNFTIPDLYQVVVGKIAGYSLPEMNVVLGHMSNILQVLALAGIVPIIIFFLLLDGHLIQKALLRTVPNRYFEMVVLLYHKIATSLQLFIRGQLVDALAVGVMTTTGFACIGLPNWLIVGTIAGLGTVIPYLGNIIGLMSAMTVLVVAGEFTTLFVIKVLAVYLTVQFVEGTFVYPVVVGTSVNLHPLLVLLAITIGGQVGGVLGMLLAIPLVCVVKVTIEVLHANLKSYSII